MEKGRRGERALELEESCGSLGKSAVCVSKVGALVMVLAPSFGRIKSGCTCYK